MVGRELVCLSSGGFPASHTIFGAGTKGETSETGEASIDCSINRSLTGLTGLPHLCPLQNNVASYNDETSVNHFA
jgi:hypothetical protein